MGNRNETIDVIVPRLMMSKNQKIITLDKIPLADSIRVYEVVNQYIAGRIDFELINTYTIKIKDEDLSKQIVIKYEYKK